MTRLTDSIVLDDRDIQERFVRATGRGGQNLNREAIAVELRLDIGRSSLPSDLKERLTRLAGRHVTKAGELVMVSRIHRSQAKNREAARARLVALLKRAANPRTTRRTTRPPPTAREERLVSKHRQSAVKRSRSARDES
ncbi:MAG TPA: alternative ribosome rescue aminoacyl-tRNA hydrolase ArfB [Vicinamibacterales bacterium]|nr:alternative ribosome rescue aminoacyl-tRNA hydrolase ArfB [Vicinamibacterales bacterium]